MKKPSSQSLSLEASGSKEAPKKVKKKIAKKKKLKKKRGLKRTASVTRTVNRKRYTSRAWHAGAVEAKHQGLEGDAYYEKAREFSQRASEEFERLWPTPADAARAADVD